MLANVRAAEKRYKIDDDVGWCCCFTSPSLAWLVTLRESASRTSKRGKVRAEEAAVYAVRFHTSTFSPLHCLLLYISISSAAKFKNIIKSNSV